MRRAASGHGAWEAALLPAAIEWRMPGSVIDAFVDGLSISRLGSAVEFAPAGLQSRHCCSAASGRSFALDVGK